MSKDTQQGDEKKEGLTTLFRILGALPSSAQHQIARFNSSFSDASTRAEIGDSAGTLASK